MKSYILRFIATSGRHSSHDMGGLSILVGLSLPAGGFAADEISTQVGVVLRAIDALFGARLLGRGHELGDAVIAEEDGLMRAEALRDLLAERLRHDQVGRVGEHGQRLEKRRPIMSDGLQWLAER